MGAGSSRLPSLSGVVAYGQMRDDVMAKVEALALRVLADEAIVNRFVWLHDFK